MLWKLAPVPWVVVQVAAVVGFAALPAGFLIGSRRSVSLGDAARWLDGKQKLQERLSTALEVGAGPASESELRQAWRELILNDATAAATQVDAAKLLPLRLPRFSRYVTVVLAVAAILGFLPEYRTRAHIQQKKETEIVKEVGRQLNTLAKRNLEQRRPALESTRKNLEEVKDLGNRLSQAKLSREEALQDLAKATDQLKQEAAELARNPGLKKLEQAARTPSGEAQQTQSGLQKQMDSLQKQLGDKQGNPEDIDKLQKDLQKLKEAAKGLADNNSAAAQAARNQMAQSASELARKAESLGMSLPSLEEAVTALQNAQVEQFLKDLNLAQQDLEKLAEMAKAMAQLQQQAEKLGKDLAEQLKNGQAQAAIESLQKMMDQLNAPNLSPAEMAKLAEQIASSIKPGEPYGEVSDHLKKAALASKAGDKPKSAAALAEAQKELKSLLDKMGDAQALMSSLSDLQRAQMAVGNCVGWAQCNSPFASKKSGQGKGGKGVGTWANSSAWSMPDHIDDLWDNTGVERPDQAGKGHTERDASRPDGLVPTKVKGQMQTGAPMPSITLKGVSIKGDSKVAYTEAVTAAQIDAQAALSQDQVPKAYRNSVRDYFDEIKK